MKVKQEVKKLYASFDIGSGMTKLQVVSATPKRHLNDKNYVQDLKSTTPDVMQPARGFQSKYLFELLETRTKVLMLGHDLQRKQTPVDERATTAPKSLSENILKDCEQTIEEMLKVCSAHQVEKENIIGYATEVFRVASNGQAFLSTLASKFELPLSVVEQTTEAKIGYYTAKVSLSLNQGIGSSPSSSSSSDPETKADMSGYENMAVWDSGAGSFQFSNETGEIIIGKLGSSIVTGYLAKLKAVGIHDALTPVTVEEYSQIRKQLVDFITTDGRIDYKHRKTLLQEKQVVAIGDYTSVFAALSLLKQHALVHAEPTEHDIITLEDVKQMEQLVVGKEKQVFEQWEIPQANMLVPKLCLVSCIMETFSITKFRYLKATGGCLGYLYMKLHDLV